MKKKTNISVLEGKIKGVEEKLEKVVYDKFNRLEKLNEEIVVKMKELEGNLPTLVGPTPANDAEKLQCTKCDFLTSSDQGKKVHMTRKHTQTNSVKYPKKCYLCEKQFGNPTEFKQHMKTHSYKEAKFKCEDCSFVWKF